MAAEPEKRAEGQRWWWAPVPILLLVFATMTAWELLGGKQQSKEELISYSTFYDLVSAGKVASVMLSNQTVVGHLKGQETVEGRPTTEFRTVLPPIEDRDFLPLLRDKKVQIIAENAQTSFLGPVLASILPWVLIGMGWIWLSRRAQRMMPGGGAPGFLGSKTHRFEVEEHVRVRFEDVAGLKSAKRDLEEIVQFLREPERFQRLGSKLPRGVLLVGPPGTGKTLLARAVAGEAGVPFFSIDGSEFIQLFVGVGASRVRELFAEANKVAPAIIFIDEIDAVGRTRGTGLGGGNDEREQTLNQLLSMMDGFTRNDLIVVIAATNRPDVLDSALLRPGRFDRRVVVDHPEYVTRLAILRVHSRNKPLGPDVSLEDVAANTPGFSGADLANLVNEAALNATRRDADALAKRDFAAAMDKIVLGDPRETLLDPNERRRVATHESGHAIVAHYTPQAEALRRVTILPRGMALGATQQTAVADRHIVTEPELHAKLKVLLGGYAAESFIYGNVSSGSENDLRQATDVAYHMVAHYGMSERVGPVYHEQRSEHPFLGQRLAIENSTVSDETAHIIEEEARRILARAVEAARSTIESRRESLERLVHELLEHETLEKEELELILLDRGELAGAPV